MRCPLGTPKARQLIAFDVSALSLTVPKSSAGTHRRSVWTG